MVPYQPQIQYVKPVQPQFFHQTVQPLSSSIHTVADIESFMHMEKWSLNQLSAFKPYSYGAMQNSAPIFCSNKDNWNVLIKAIVYRCEVEETFNKIDEFEDNQATIMIANQVAMCLAKAFHSCNLLPTLK